MWEVGTSCTSASLILGYVSNSWLMDKPHLSHQPRITSLLTSASLLWYLSNSWLMDKPHLSHQPHITSLLTSASLLWHLSNSWLMDKPHLSHQPHITSLLTSASLLWYQAPSLTSASSKPLTKLYKSRAYKLYFMVVDPWTSPIFHTLLYCMSPPLTFEAILNRLLERRTCAVVITLTQFSYLVFCQVSSVCVDQTAKDFNLCWGFSVFQTLMLE